MDPRNKFIDAWGNTIYIEPQNNQNNTQNTYTENKDINQQLTTSRTKKVKRKVKKKIEKKRKKKKVAKSSPINRTYQIDLTGVWHGGGEIYYLNQIGNILFGAIFFKGTNTSVLNGILINDTVSGIESQTPTSTNFSYSNFLWQISSDGKNIITKSGTCGRSSNLQKVEK